MKNVLSNEVTSQSQIEELTNEIRKLTDKNEKLLEVITQLRFWHNGCL